MKPNKAYYNQDRKTSSLFFDDEKIDGEYHMRGGICWPTGYEFEGTKDIMGYAILGGYNVLTKKLWLFEQRAFVIIDSILDDDGKIVFHGLATWFNDNWSRYFAKNYYWNQEDHLKLQHSLEIRDSRMIDPKPQFIETEWSSINEMQHILWKYIKLGSKKVYLGSKGSMLKLHIDVMKQDDKEALPAVHALFCLLAGLAKRPYRKRKEI